VDGADIKFDWSSEFLEMDCLQQKKTEFVVALIWLL
jgi:hypothetical protein